MADSGDHAGRETMNDETRSGVGGQSERSAAASSAKVCLACGVDCSELPRTKDTRGHYFCQECFDDLMARRRRGERLSIRVKSAEPSGPPTNVDDAIASLAIPEDSPLVDPAIGSLDADEPATPTVRCGGCGAELAVDAVICIECGYEPRRGALAGTSLIRSRARSRRRDAAWRTPIGIVAIVAGAVGIVISGAGIVAAIGVALTAPTPGLVATLIALLLTLIALDHLRGGIGLLRRDRVAVDRLRLSSGLFILMNLIGAASQFVTHKLATATSENVEVIPFDVETLVIGIAFVCAWPLFALLFLGQKQVRRSVRMW